ncbi:ABC transporter substrate-binding protein [Dehalobacterium formicoaceticum]|uniref:ABC transporter substrate-binding protein n=1 Tax=Dehalobacterium formicoaceticum TaxID=51515 RepID=A0ABT1Y4G3_9FIRM|nr:ABC transporter substrate-binding protein [Dehalobacterium formicoaceticum]MCR6545760.1 ABC transporter substrate-binding protein [Dehalobacterium formicoaceticum]
MKKIIWIISLIMIFSLTAAGCGNNNEQSQGTGNEKESADKNIKLGIIQISEHAALDASRKGFLDVLAENGYKDGENLTVDYHNAQGDQSNLQTIANKFVADRVDMVLAIATPSAIAMAGATEDIPILITAVTDPVTAKLVDSNEKPGGNVTGTTDLAPAKDQFELLKKIVPDAKKIGVIYNSSEVNSQVQVEMVKEAAKDMDLEIVEATISNSAEVMQAAQSLVGKVDAIYAPSDNNVASSMPSVVSVAEKNQIPFFVSVEDMVDDGALGAMGIDYYELGRMTGAMAIKVINGENTAEMPIEGLPDFKIIINKGAAERMGVTVPQEVLNQAERIID